MCNKKVIFPTMITPYKKDGSVDYEGVEKLVEWYYDKGCEGIFAVCQSSEIFKLSLSERVKIAACVVKKAKALEQEKGRKMEIVGSGHISDDFEEQVRELTAIAETGVEAVIFISNRFDIANTSEEKWIEDMQRTVQALPVNVKFGVYECPYPYKRLLTEGMLKACAQTGRFSFIKDTCCDADMIAKRVEILKGSGIRLLNANAQTLLQTVRAGADGYSGIMANFHPQLYKLLFSNIESEQADILQAFIAMSAFTESLAYPATAKYYLKEFEGIDIQPLSRTADCRLITPYQKSCLKQMKLLGDTLYNNIRKEGTL